MKTFAIIGAAGYIAPRHMQAIKDVGGQLVAALDPHDSVGVLDRFAPDCLYFREPERFDRWLSKNPVDYVVVASPNYLHDSHALMAMRNGCDVICEKPLVCNERNLDNLAVWEEKTGKKVNVILQCRLHDQATLAKAAVLDQDHMVTIDYQTPRGPWYDFSWKSDIKKSGGIATNIGIHLFDLCHWLFGPAKAMTIKKQSSHVAFGFMQMRRAEVSWAISIENGERRRVFTITPENKSLYEVDLTHGFDDLHTKSYKRILSGEGFGIEDIRPATRMVEEVRYAK